jgi:hypothetical protein
MFKKDIRTSVPSSVKKRLWNTATIMKNKKDKGSLGKPLLSYKGPLGTISYQHVRTTVFFLKKKAIYYLLQ